MSDNQGLLIGSVASYDPQRGEAAVRLCASLVPEKGDGLVFQSPGQEMGLVVQKAIEKDGLVRLRTPDRVRPGARVFLTGSTALARRAEEIAARERASIPVDITLTWEDGFPVAEGRLDSGELAVARGESRMEEAVNRPQTPEQIESQMRKTGGTPFVVRKVEMDYPGGLFSPPGALNQLRRDLLAGLEKAVLEGRRPASDRIREAKDRLQKLELPARRAGEEWSRPKLSVYADRLDILKGAVEGGSRRIYFEPLMEKGRKDRDRIETILARLQEAKELCSKAELIWKWPRITRDDFIDLALPLLSEVQVNGIMVENVGPAWAIKEKMPEMPIYGGSGLNVWNHLTAQALAPQFSWLTLSPELSSHQLKDAASALRALPGRDGNPKLELVVQGSLEVMVAEDSVPQLAKGRSSEEFWGLQDFKHIFPLKVDDEGRTHIFNSAETCLIDLLPEICRIGLDGISLDARGRTESYARQVTGAYNQAIERTEKLLATDPAPLKEGLLDLKARIQPLALGGITHGHFLRGLKD